MSSPIRLVVAAGLALSLSLTPAFAEPPAAPETARKVVKTADDLPRHTYKIEGKASEFVLSDAPFKALVEEVKADLASDLRQFQIEDPSTLQGYYGVQQQIALFEGRGGDARALIEQIRELETKESKRLMTGQVLTAMLDAEKSSGGRAGDSKFDSAFKANLDRAVRSLPWTLVREDVLQAKGRAEIIRRELIIGSMQGQLDPIVAQSGGEISGDLARSLIGARVTLDRILPLQPMIAEVFAAIVADKEAKVTGVDIWTPAQVELTEADKGSPVVIGIWDSGVDVRIFPTQLFVNPGETPGNGKDDDGNGFVDDDHGIAFDLDSNRVPGPLADLSELGTPLAEASRFDKGFSDLNNSIESADADLLKKHIRSLKAEEVTPFLEDLNLYGGYCHGTHVAGIAAAGNPYARILYARITFDHRAIPLKAPTVEQARRDAQATLDTIDYFKKAGVRVVNMSFGGSRADIEAALEAKGVGKTTEERAALSREIFVIGRDAAEQAMKNAPDILFIAAAGNSDEDNEFSEVLPSCLNLPNLITIGAIDATGKPTTFTTFGKNVKLYANGFEVDSFVPGGEKRKYSGTSMAAPNAANLVGKLLALHPSLSTAQVIDLLDRGADPLDGYEGRFIINPKKTLELAAMKG